MRTPPTSVFQTSLSLVTYTINKFIKVLFYIEETHTKIHLYISPKKSPDN